jgi:hypothetical protein
MGQAEVLSCARKSENRERRSENWFHIKPAPIAHPRFKPTHQEPLPAGRFSISLQQVEELMKRAVVSILILLVVASIAVAQATVANCPQDGQKANFTGATRPNPHAPPALECEFKHVFFNPATKQTTEHVFWQPCGS